MLPEEDRALPCKQFCGLEILQLSEATTNCAAETPSLHVCGLLNSLLGPNIKVKPSFPQARPKEKLKQLARQARQALNCSIITHAVRQQTLSMRSTREDGSANTKLQRHKMAKAPNDLWRRRPLLPVALTHSSQGPTAAPTTASTLHTSLTKESFQTQATGTHQSGIAHLQKQILSRRGQWFYTMGLTVSRWQLPEQLPNLPLAQGRSLVMCCLRPFIQMMSEAQPRPPGFLKSPKPETDGDAS